MVRFILYIFVAWIVLSLLGVLLGAIVGTITGKSSGVGVSYAISASNKAFKYAIGFGIVLTIPALIAGYSYGFPDFMNVGKNAFGDYSSLDSLVKTFPITFMSLYTLIFTRCIYLKVRNPATK